MKKSWKKTLIKKRKFLILSNQLKGNLGIIRINITTSKPHQIDKAEVSTKIIRDMVKMHTSTNIIIITIKAKVNFPNTF